MQHEPREQAATVLWEVSCDEVDGEALEVLERMLSLDESDVISKEMLVGWRVSFV